MQKSKFVDNLTLIHNRLSYHIRDELGFVFIFLVNVRYLAPLGGKEFLHSVLSLIYTWC